MNTEDLEAGGDINPTDIRVAAMNLLARREHSLDELRSKLCRRFADADLVEDQLQQLRAENLQSDERFAESFARQRANRGYGPGRVRQEMRQRGLSDAAISTALDTLDMDWFALAETVWRKKFNAPASDLKNLAKQQRFMQYRGFSAEYYEHLVQLA